MSHLSWSMPRIVYWDCVLIAVVSLQATVLAYLYQPKWKAFALTLPIPFTVACLSVGRPVNATNVLGLLLLLCFTHGVRWLHYDLHKPILLSIVVAVVGYCAVGASLARSLGDTDEVFWASCLAVLSIATVFLRRVKHREEPGHRTPLPVWIKLPLIVGVVLFLVVMKNTLKGFMTTFPMVGVIAAYEARHSLWTTSRQIPVTMLTMTLMMIVCRMTQNRIGLGPSLGLSWVALLVALVPLTRYLWAAASEADNKNTEECACHNS